MMFVIVALVGLFQLPPRLSLYCANVGAMQSLQPKLRGNIDLTANVSAHLFISLFEYG